MMRTVAVPPFAAGPAGSDHLPQHRAGAIVRVAEAGVEPVENIRPNLEADEFDAGAQTISSYDIPVTNLPADSNRTEVLPDDKPAWCGFVWLVE